MSAVPPESRGELARDRHDHPLVAVTLLLAGVGLVFVLSASQALALTEHLFALYFFARQLAGVAIGLLLMVVLSRIDYHRLREYAQPVAMAALFLMVLVLVPHLGVQINGARRWFSVGPFGTVQPSEVGKLAFVLFIAHWVDKRGERIRSLEHGVLPFVVMVGAVLAVLMLEKDLGTAIVTAAIFGSVYFAGGGRKSHILLMLVVLALGFAALTLAEPYRVARFASWGNPFGDALNTGFQSSQAIIGLGAGGLSGVGLGHSVQKFLWLPAAHTDFIFAIIGEETGLAGTTAVLAAFVFFSWRGYRAALRAPDRFGVMVGVGITTWVAIQALINMGTVTDTIPATGVPLPFISYGGTSVVILLAAVGVLLNVSSQGHDQSFRRFDATLDLGRGNRRPPDARSRRRAGLPR